MKNKITPKQSMFVKEYLVDLNAMQAAIRAGYSKKTASVIGDENLRKPYIAKHIQQAMDERSVKTKITQEMVINNLESLRTKAIEENQLSVAARCLELLGKHLAMFKNDSNQEKRVQIIINCAPVKLQRGNNGLVIDGIHGQPLC